MPHGEMDERTFAERLRLLMSEKGWTQAEMGTRCGVSKRAVESYLAGTSPGAESIAKIARGAHVSADWLLFGKTPRIDYEALERAIHAAAFRILRYEIEIAFNAGWLSSENVEKRERLHSELPATASFAAKRTTDLALENLNALSVEREAQSLKREP